LLFHGFSVRAGRSASSLGGSRYIRMNPVSSFVPAEMVSSDGQILSIGEASLPPDVCQPTFLPKHLKTQGTQIDLSHAAILRLSTGKAFSIADVRECCSVGREHYHFSVQ